MSEGTLQAVDYEPIEFANDQFIKGRPELIHQIKRKDTKPRSNSTQVCSKQNFPGQIRSKIGLFVV